MQDNLTRFHQQFGVISMERQMPELLEVQTMNGRAYQYAGQGTVTVRLELPMDQFFNLVNATQEFDKLEQDPVTADLIKEAKFVYKLKHGV
jgi:hypothetical protein